MLAILGYLSLPVSDRRLANYVRLGSNAVLGVGLCLLATLKYNETLQGNFLASAWMIPTVCFVYCICVVINHIRVPKKQY